MRIAVAAAALFLTGLAAPAADAQVTIGAAIGQANQASGQSDSPYLGPGFGGSSLAGFAMIDVAIRPRVAVGGEVSLAADISGTQNQRAAGGNNHVVRAHHDTVLSGVVKVGSPSGERVRAHGVIGGGIAQRRTDRTDRTDRTGTFATTFSPATTPFHETLTDYVWALTAGVDVAVEISDHVAFLAIGRFHQLKTTIATRAASSIAGCPRPSPATAAACRSDSESES